MNSAMPRPLIAKTLDRVLRASAITLKNDYLASSALLNAASRRTELDDFGETAFTDAFNSLAISIEKNGNLNNFGRFALRNYLIETLIKRLKIIEFLKHHPDIASREIDAPIFITGWYRTGTTYLHNLIWNNAKDTRAPLLWELMNPCPALDSGKTNTKFRILKTRMTTAFQRLISPDFQAAHPLTATMPDECLHLMENAGLSSMAFFLTEAIDHAWRQLQASQEPAYRFYKKQLQLLDWQRPGKRWLLKWPYHLWHLKSLFKVFPDARVIWLRRDPLEAIPSVCGLAELARLPFCHDVDRKSLGRFWLQYCKTGQECGDEIAENGGAILKIDNTELLKDRRTVLDKIAKHANLDMNMPTDFKSTLADSTKQYSAEDYGLSREIILNHFQ